METALGPTTKNVNVIIVTVVWIADRSAAAMAVVIMGLADVMSDGVETRVAG